MTWFTLWFLWVMTDLLLFYELLYQMGYDKAMREMDEQLPADS